MSQRSVPAAQTELLNNIHKVEGFDPSAFAVDYTDLNTQETRKRLPVMAQIAWFRLVYREGKIAVSVEQNVVSAPSFNECLGVLNKRLFLKLVADKA